jgi:hypothetical protein
MRNLFRGTNILIFVVLDLFMLYLLGFYVVDLKKVFLLIPQLVRFLTFYIFPWIFLYWFIRLVQAFESK